MASDSSHEPPSGKHDPHDLDDERAIDLVEREHKEANSISDLSEDDIRLARRGLDLVRLASLSRVADPASSDKAETPKCDDSANAVTRVASEAGDLEYGLSSGTPLRIGRFEILHELGRGGFGVVLLARDPILNRLVALKLPRIELFGSELARRRFEREARAAAMLTHPGIVPLLETQLDGPIQYIAFAYVPGESLARFLTRQLKPLSNQTAARMVAALADAVEHAHQRGVIHRDLKPNNILIASPDPADPLTDIQLVHSLRITDFGLAKVGENRDSQSLTRAGAIVGTPAYMAPEQAIGADEAASPASDIWSLGTILYQLLTGRPPFQGASDLATLRLIEQENPTPLRAVQPSVAADLQAICLKCLEKRPSDRYSRAGDLATDLNRWIDGLPVAARPITRFGRVWRWTNRNRTLALSLAFAFASLATGLGVAVVQQQFLRQQLDEVSKEKKRADQQKIAAIEQREIADSIRGFLFDDLLNGADAQYQITRIDRAQAMGLGRLAYRTSPTINQLVHNVLPDLEANQLEQRFPGQPLVQAELLSTVSRLLIFQGQFTSALPLTEQAVARFEAAAGDTDERTLRARYMKGVVLGGLGRFEESHALHASLFNQQLKNHASPSDVTRTMYALAATLSRLGKRDEALATLKQIYEREKAAYDVNDAQVRRATNVLAHFHLTNVNHEQARQILKQTYPDLDAQTKLTGESLAIDLEVLDSLEYLAECESRAGNPEQAIDILEQVVSARDSLLGNSHYSSLLSRIVHAKALTQAKRFEASIAAHQSLLTVIDKELGKDSSLSLACTSNLANALWSDGQFTRAIPLQRKLYEHAMEQGRSNSNSLVYMANLGCSLRDAGEHQESIDLLERVVEKGESIPALKWVQHELIWAYERAGDIEKAESRCRLWLSELRATENPAANMLVRPLSSLGRNLLAQGKMQEAESVFRELMKLVDSGELPRATNNWLCQESIVLLGACLVERNQLKEAGAYLESGCRHLESNLPPPAFHPNIAICYRHLIGYYELTNQPELAQEWEQKLTALRIEPPTMDAPR